MPTNSEDINEVTATSTKESPKYEDKIKANVDLLVDNSSSFVSCRCSCGVLAAELEGVKLDIVILQKRMDLQVNSTTERMSRDDDEMNRLKREILEEKEKSKRLEADLLLIVREWNKDVDELNNTISYLETKIIN